MKKLKVPEKLKSRKLWLAVASAFITFGNAMWDWGLSQQEVESIVIPLLAYVGIEGIADIRHR